MSATGREPRRPWGGGRRRPSWPRQLIPAVPMTVGGPGPVVHGLLSGLRALEGAGLPTSTPGARRWAGPLLAICLSLLSWAIGWIHWHLLPLGPGPMTASALQEQPEQAGPSGLTGRLGQGRGGLGSAPCVSLSGWGALENPVTSLGSCASVCRRDQCLLLSEGCEGRRALCDQPATSCARHTYLCHFLHQVKPAAGRSRRVEERRNSRNMETNSLSPPARA